VRTDPKVIGFLAARAKQFRSIDRLVLFGSRARGDAMERSDYDVGVYAPKMSDSDWASFAVGVGEEKPTLCGIDLVRLPNGIAEDLRKKIESEGVTIYESQTVQKG
jgi:uncharacterized protein